MGLLDNLEEALDSPDSTVRLCAAYVVSRLVRNSQVRAVHALEMHRVIVRTCLEWCQTLHFLSSVGGRKP